MASYLVLPLLVFTNSISMVPWSSPTSQTTVSETVTTPLLFAKVGPDVIRHPVTDGLFALVIVDGNEPNVNVVDWPGQTPPVGLPDHVPVCADAELPRNHASRKST